MILYLAQHGTAVDKTIDPDRPLSAAGQAEVRRVAAVGAAAGMAPARVLHSGKTRASETARLFSETIPVCAAPEEVSGIAPMDPVEGFAAEAGAWTEDVLVCGHQPFMGRLVSLLLCGDATRVTLEYRPGSMAAIGRTDDGKWHLRWFLRPDSCPGS
ncbi:MAG: phosphohistidine phosphatase SixA [Gammaproteobacteria bacterium]|nr:phosphohistidine phosphatase SixA [Gammaproteobacteria bacterium]